MAPKPGCSHLAQTDFAKGYKDHGVRGGRGFKGFGVGKRRTSSASASSTPN
jgi:hypothetical protein